MSDIERATAVIAGASPDAAAHLRPRLQAAGVTGLFIPSWPPDESPGSIAAVVVWCDDAPGTAATVRRATAAPLLLIARTLDGRAWQAALDAGADACLVATISSAVIAAQLAALLRSRPAVKTEAASTLSCGALVLDLPTRRVTCAGADIKLNRREFDLLAHMARHRATVLQRHELLSAVWGAGFMGDSNTVDVHIAWLRQKLPRDCGVRITTLRGLGYRLDELTAQSPAETSPAPAPTEAAPAAPRGTPARTSRRGR